MGNIETGVDRLVELINLAKRISIDDAAKKLGISKIVIQEWADFLEEEKIISIDYKLSKTFLVERKLSQEEIKVKEKEYSSEKDAFVRKVETGLKNLEKDTLTLESIKNEFDNLKTEIGAEINKVRAEVGQLQKYEYLKKNLNQDIEKQVAEFNLILNNSHKEIDSEQKRHQELLQSLEIEKRELQVKEHRLLGLAEKEREIMDRIQRIFDLAREIEKRVESERSDISEAERRILELQKTAKNIESNIVKKKQSIQPMLDKAKNHEEQILKLQDDILQKAKDKTDAIKNKVEEGSKVVDKFEKFFEKKAEVENFMMDIDKEKKELIESFRILAKKALAFDIATKSNSVKTHVKDLEKDLDNINLKKAKFKEDLEKLINLIKG